MNENIFITLSNAETYLNNLDITLKHDEPQFMKEYALSTTERAEHYQAYRLELMLNLAEARTYIKVLRAHLSKLSK